MMAQRRSKGPAHDGAAINDRVDDAALREAMEAALYCADAAWMIRKEVANDYPEREFREAHWQRFIDKMNELSEELDRASARLERLGQNRLDALASQGELVKQAGGVVAASWHELAIRLAELIGYCTGNRAYERSLTLDDAEACIASIGRTIPLFDLGLLFVGIKQESRRLAAMQAESASTADTVSVDAAEQYVTLLQAAAMVSRNKATLRRRLQSGKIPPPDIKGGGRGKPDEWQWSKLRPVLENEFSRSLPGRVPTMRP